MGIDLKPFRHQQGIAVPLEKYKQLLKEFGVENSSY